MAFGISKLAARGTFPKSYYAMKRSFSLRSVVWLFITMKIASNEKYLIEIRRIANLEVFLIGQNYFILRQIRRLFL